MSARYTSLICVLLQIFFFLTSKAGFASEKSPLRVLHLTYHVGCERELAVIANKLGLDLTTKYVPNLLDADTRIGRNPYEIDRERALRIYQKYESYFNEYDAIITSDTAPVSRIFLQNNWKKPLIIWVCNRFDWDTHDSEYYELFKKVTLADHALVIPYTKFEVVYAKKLGIDFNHEVIRVCSPYLEIDQSDQKTKSKLFMTTRTADVQQSHGFPISQFLGRSRIPIDSYRYEGMEALKNLRNYIGSLCFPYQWSQIIFFESLALGLPVFLPSAKFLKEMLRKGYFFEIPDYISEEEIFNSSEWYCEEFKDGVVFFDSFRELYQLVNSPNRLPSRETVLNLAKQHQEKTIQQWSKVFDWMRCRVGRKEDPF